MTLALRRRIVSGFMVADVFGGLAYSDTATLSSVATCGFVMTCWMISDHRRYMRNMKAEMDQAAERRRKQALARQRKHMLHMLRNEWNYNR